MLRTVFLSVLGLLAIGTVLEEVSRNTLEIRHRRRIAATRIVNSEGEYIRSVFLGSTPHRANALAPLRSRPPGKCVPRDRMTVLAS